MKTAVTISETVQNIALGMVCIDCDSQGRPKLATPDNQQFTLWSLSLNDRTGSIATASVFWRTQYFANDVLRRRPELDPIEIRRVIAQPEKKAIQEDGRIRLYGFAASLGCYLRVVLLSDGETVHNAFPDEDFVP